MNDVLISPSILSCDFTDVRGAVEEIERSGAEWVHCDVMDGVFVPNISFGQKMVNDVAKMTDLVVDVHLMIVHPEKYIEEFAKSGAKYITFHYEATDCVEDTLKLIKKCGCKAGLAIKPATDVSVFEKYLPLIDVALIMSVEPGFSGQKFIQTTFLKMQRFCEMAKGGNIIMQGDGGINLQNAKQVIDAGCGCIVAGNAFFSSQDKQMAVKTLKGLI